MTVNSVIITAPPRLPFLAVLAADVIMSVFWETFCVGIWRGFGDGGRKEIWKIRSFLIIIIVNEKRGKEKKRGI